MSTPLPTNNRFNALNSGNTGYRPPKRNTFRSKQSMKKYTEPEQWVPEVQQEGNPFTKKKFDINTESFPVLSENVDISHSNMQYKNKIKNLFQKQRKNKDVVKPGMIRWRKNKNTNCWIRKDGCTKEMDEWKKEEGGASVRPGTSGNAPAKDKESKFHRSNIRNFNVSYQHEFEGEKTTL